MPEDITIYKLFVASPSDVAEEKQAIKKIISEMNTYYKDFKYQLEYKDWEDCTPGLGRSQSHIDDELITSCDIFICLMWKRYGQILSEGNPISHTEGEFNFANQLFIKNKSPYIMVFFKAISDSDSPDIEKINQFKNKIIKENVVILSEFIDIEELTKKVSLYLSQIMVKIIKNRFKTDDKIDDTNKINILPFISSSISIENGEIVDNHLQNYGSNTIDQPIQLKLYADPEIILSGGDATNITALILEHGKPCHRAGIKVNFRIDNLLIAQLPSNSSNVTNTSGYTTIPLFSVENESYYTEKRGVVNVTADAIVGNRTISNTIQVKIVGWGNIYGLVLDSNGEGIPNSTVKLWKYELSNLTNNFEITKLLPSPENPQYSFGVGDFSRIGRFIFRRVPWGKYCITAEKANSSGEVRIFYTIVDVENGTTTCNILIPGYVNPIVMKPILKNDIQ